MSTAGCGTYGRVASSRCSRARRKRFASSPPPVSLIRCKRPLDACGPRSPAHVRNFALLSRASSGPASAFSPLMRRRLLRQLYLLFALVLASSCAASVDQPNNGGGSGGNGTGGMTGNGNGSGSGSGGGDTNAGGSAGT